MARVDLLGPEDVPAEYRRWMQRPITLVRVLAHSPEGLAHFQATGEWLRHGTVLDERLRELAVLNVGYLTRTEYEYSHHVRIGRECGLSDDDIRALATATDGYPGLDEPARTVLVASREITCDGAVSDASWATLTRLLGTQGAVELVLATAHYNAVVRVLASLQVDVEDDYAAYLAEFPLPPEEAPA